MRKSEGPVIQVPSQISSPLEAFPLVVQPQYSFPVTLLSCVCKTYHKLHLLYFAFFVPCPSSNYKYPVRTYLFTALSPVPKNNTWKIEPQ